MSSPYSKTCFIFSLILFTLKNGMQKAEKNEVSAVRGVLTEFLNLPMKNQVFLFLKSVQIHTFVNLRKMNF